MIPLIDPLLSWLHINYIQALIILSIPLIIDFPRSFGKALFLLFHEAYEKLRRQPRPPYQPFISVIIPARNEEETIEKTIEALLETDYPNKEIIVVDDDSTDCTYQIAAKYAQQGLIKLFRRETSSGQKAVVVNYGLLFAQGEIIVCIDADTVVERDSLRNIVAPFADPKVGAVAGNVRVLNKVNFLTSLQSYEYLMAMEMGRRFQAVSRTLLVVPGAFGAVRRELLASLGKYDVDTSTEDFDVTLKVHKTLYKVKFGWNSLGWTYVPEKWRDWLRQRIRWSMGQMQTLMKHRDAFFRPIFGWIGVVAVPEMLLTDFIFLLARMLWLLLLPVLYPHLLWPIFVLITLFYLANEVFLVLAAAILSPRKGDLAYAIYIPLVTFLYRPLYSVVRLKAYVDSIIGRRAAW